MVSLPCVGELAHVSYLTQGLLSVGRLGQRRGGGGEEKGDLVRDEKEGYKYWSLLATVGSNLPSHHHHQVHDGRLSTAYTNELFLHDSAHL